MGYVINHVIVITSWDDSVVNKAVEKAKSLGMSVIGPGKHKVNSGASAMICPDGSKEGWVDSDVGDKQRSDFTEWARDQCYSDGSTCLSWAEVAFGGDEPDLNTEILGHNGDEIDKLRYVDG
jgi:hypothetical protein